MTFNRHTDERIRTAAFEWLTRMTDMYGDVLPRRLLEDGFDLDGERVRLIGPQGIFKPKVMKLPLTITTAPRGPYDDSLGADNLVRYRYRGDDPNHRDNVGLRTVMGAQLPLVYLHGIIPGKYFPIWPVYIVADQPEQRVFSVAVDGALPDALSHPEGETGGLITEIRREYAVTQTRTRLHQSAFRERVLQAYQHQCALCRLRHSELLDAAHIIPDSEPHGGPTINNGIALCRLHHAAFDRFFLAVSPDHIIEIRRDLLEESDGPTLRHALQGLHGQRIALPRRADEWPSRIFLTERYERFLERAGSL